MELQDTQRMNITDTIQEGVIEAVHKLYGEQVETEKVVITVTRKQFEGDYTVVVFPFSKIAKKKPEAIGDDLGHYLLEHNQYVKAFNVVQGFLNLEIETNYWKDFLLSMSQDKSYGQHPSNGKKVMVEFASPNTNKPLHLGHIRNILLGWSSAKMLEAAGYEVVKVQIVNDRGIAICKSMLAWQKFGNKMTPDLMNIKSDHFVGNYYVLFETKFKEEYTEWQATDEGKAAYKAFQKGEQTEEKFFKDYKNKYFNEFSALGKEARDMLQKWEAGDKEVKDLWNKMNAWVYEGFEKTYTDLGVEFDKLYYESNTYLLGKDLIDKGLSDQVFYKKDDDSVWADLEDAKLDHKIVLRSDGTSVYMTQDLGTAHLRYEDFGVERMIYVVADEQNYHFKVLFEILKRLEEPYAAGLHHLAYGMVDLTTGKMKSREGTVVDADDLMEKVIEEAKNSTEDRGLIQELTPDEQDQVNQKIGMGALKYFILKVNPKKRMVFDPKESVDMQGNTGPYIQNAYVRILSVLRKAGEVDTSNASDYKNLKQQETELIKMIFNYSDTIQKAAEEYDASIIASYCYDLAKGYHKFYHDLSINKAESNEAKSFRIELSQAVANTLESAMILLGIEMPERM